MSSKFNDWFLVLSMRNEFETHHIIYYHVDNYIGKYVQFVTVQNSAYLI